MINIKGYCFDPKYVSYISPIYAPYNHYGAYNMKIIVEGIEINLSEGLKHTLEELKKEILKAKEPQL